nr:hypothetical protein [Tanacetum cinerariifolium]
DEQVARLLPIGQPVEELRVLGIFGSDPLLVIVQNSLNTGNFGSCFCLLWHEDENEGYDAGFVEKRYVLGQAQVQAVVGLGVAARVLAQVGARLGVVFENEEEAEHQADAHTLEQI